MGARRKPEQTLEGTYKGRSGGEHSVKVTLNPNQHKPSRESFIEPLYDATLRIQLDGVSLGIDLTDDVLRVSGMSAEMGADYERQIQGVEWKARDEQKRRADVAEAHLTQTLTMLERTNERADEWERKARVMATALSETISEFDTADADRLVGRMVLALARQGFDVPTPERTES
jgi:hypothetical protein